jgi:ElaB/YqjD/DUF883 family membrane-anchored ribosome-binding protein
MDKVGTGFESRGSEHKEFGRQIERGAEATRDALSNAYDTTSAALNDTYEWLMNYGRDNPGRTILIALGAGAGIGFLLANHRASSRPAAYFDPVVNAVSRFASDVFRRR